MCRINFTTISLLLVLGTGGLMSESTRNADGSVKGLYEYLLQREYAAPVPYVDHQIKRKAVRSPSLRLRFGRRSDPAMPVEPEDDELVDDVLLEEKRAPSQRLRWGRSGGMGDVIAHERPIRAPQLRLRFGRGDPLWTSLNENALLEEKRAPSQRLRWGRSGGMLSSNDVMQQKAIRAPQLRLRFGRSDPSLAMFNEHQLTEQQITDDARNPSKTLQLRAVEPTSIESAEQPDSEEKRPRSMDEE